MRVMLSVHRDQRAQPVQLEQPGQLEPLGQQARREHPELPQRLRWELPQREHPEVLRRLLTLARLQLPCLSLPYRQDPPDPLGQQAPQARREHPEPRQVLRFFQLPHYRRAQVPRWLTLVHQ
jgi:hypothetical protein